MVRLKPQSFRVIEADSATTEQDESPIQHVGAFLREARETTGRSLADVATALRIRAKFLKSIEDGRYEDLPGPTYTLGFIRSYADYLGLDSDALLVRFKTESSGSDGHPNLEFPAPSTVGWFPTGTVVVACAVLAAVVFAGWFYLQTKNSVDVAIVPPPPGFKSAIAANANIEKPLDDEVAATRPAVAEPVAPGDDSSADQTVAAIVQPAVPETDTPRATSGETTSDAAEQPYQLPVPIAALVLPDPVATEADLKQPRPVETVSEARSPAMVAPTPAPIKVVEPPPSDQNEPTPASANAAEPLRPVSEARQEAPPSPAPAVEPVAQIAALPRIPTEIGITNSGNDGRTYGVINQEARVIIGAQADSWVQVLDSDQNVLLTRMLRPGDRYLVPNRRDLIMLTGNAGGLIISVDGEPVPQIGSDGAILHNVRLDADLLKAGRAVIE